MFKNYFLAGGTTLSLQFGHRIPDDAKIIMKRILPVLPFIALIILITAIVSPLSAQWQALAPGLDFARFVSPYYPEETDTAHTIHILRVDLKNYELHLLNASHPLQGTMHTARGWAQKEGMTAVINAAMYQTDYRKSVSYMKTADHVNNLRMSKDKTILVFEPQQKNIPPARIVDLDCDDFEKIKTLYGSAVQSIRMLSCAGRNVWQQSDKRWSIAAVGTDKDGRVFFIQCTAPHSVHEFINVLRGLPISIERAMYMEGGSPSQLFITAGTAEMEFIGDFSNGGKSTGAAEMPNALGIRKIKR